MAWPKCPSCGSEEEVQWAARAVSCGRAWAKPRGLAVKLHEPICSKRLGSHRIRDRYYWGWPLAAVVIALTLYLMSTPELPPFGGIVLLLAMLLPALAVAFRRYWTTRETRKYNREVEAWNRYVGAKWENLCYCHRCDQVFALGSSVAMSTLDWRVTLGLSPDEQREDEERLSEVEKEYRRRKSQFGGPGAG